MYSAVPKLVLERERGRKMSKNPSARSVSGNDVVDTSMESRGNSQPNTCRTGKRTLTTDPQRSGSFSSRRTFFGISRRSPNSNTHKESPRGASPNSVSFPDPSDFVKQEPTAHVDWKKRGQAPVLEDYIISEEAHLQTSAEKRLMRDKSDKNSFYIFNIKIL